MKTEAYEDAYVTEIINSHSTIVCVSAKNFETGALYCAYDEMYVGTHPLCTDYPCTDLRSGMGNSGMSSGTKMRNDNRRMGCASWRAHARRLSRNALHG